MNTLLESFLTLTCSPRSCHWQVAGGPPVDAQTIPSIMWATPLTRKLSNVSAGSGSLMGSIQFRKMAQTSSGVANARALTGKSTGCGQNRPINVQPLTHTVKTGKSATAMSSAAPDHLEKSFAARFNPIQSNKAIIHLRIRPSHG
jgi:hypothetical protein